MKFEICYNDTKNKDVTFLKQLGATPATIDEYSFYEIEIKDFEDFAAFEKKIESIFDYKYYMIISFDPPCIYLQKELLSL